MLLSKRTLLVVAIVFALPCCTVRGADQPAGKSLPNLAAEATAVTSAQKPSAEELAKLIAQLDAPRFADRQAASEKLAAIGKPAIGALAKAAVGDSLEVTSRSIGLLAKLLESSDQATKAEARKALETIAKSNRPAAASRAQELLKPPAEQMPGGGGMGIGLGNIRIGGAAFGPGGFGHRTMKIINGVKEIEAEENGKKVKIVDDPQQGISIEATTKKDGKDVTEKYQAKDAKELEKKHPEGYKLYKEYAANQGPAGMGMFGPAPAPGNPARMFVAPLPQPTITQQVDIAAMTMRILTRRIETLSKDASLKTAPQPSKDALKKQIGDLKQQLSDLQKKLDEK
jgi:hypothetical protein